MGEVCNSHLLTSKKGRPCWAAQGHCGVVIVKFRALFNELCVQTRHVICRAQAFVLVVSHDEDNIRPFGGGRVVPRPRGGMSVVPCEEAGEQANGQDNPGRKHYDWEDADAPFPRRVRRVWLSRLFVRGGTFIGRFPGPKEPRERAIFNHSGWPQRFRGRAVLVHLADLVNQLQNEDMQ